MEIQVNSTKEKKRKKKEHSLTVKTQMFSVALWNTLLQL